MLQIPSRIAPEMALSLGHCLAGQSRKTALVRYLSLALLYLSWQFEAPGSLEAIQLGLQEFMDDDGGALLENLAHPPAYGRRGTEFRLPASQTKAAQEAATQWAHSLHKAGADVLRLHSRAQLLLAYLARPPRQELLARIKQSKDVAPLFNATPLKSQRGQGSQPATLMRPGLTIYPFDSAGSAFEFLLSRAELRREAGTQVANPELAPAPPEHGVQVFDPLRALEALKKLAPPGPDSNNQQRHLLTEMARRSGYQPLTEVPATASLGDLHKRFPHFHEVLDFIANSLALAACGEEGRPARVPPLLLRGAPGTGKTYFAQELARVLGATFIERDLSVASEAFVLSGMDAGWKNSKQGLVLDALVLGKTANPLICLNEVDKCQVGSNHRSPIASLHALLEPTSARSFQDEFATVPLDASRIIWVLTANDGTIPAAVLSRLETFEIPAPSLTQCRAIAQSVWALIVAKEMPKGHGFPRSLPDEALDCMQAVNPRVMRKALTYAASVSAFQGHKTLQVAALKVGVTRYALGPTRSIGFQAEF